jgi:hypothetical protein
MVKKKQFSAGYYPFTFNLRLDHNSKASYGSSVTYPDFGRCDASPKFRLCDTAVPLI